MPVNKVIYGNNTLIDLTGDTITSDTILEGYTAQTTVILMLPTSRGCLRRLSSTL